MTMYRLLKTQCNYLKKQILIIVDWEITEKIKKNQVIYETRYQRKILQNLHQEKKEMKNSFLNKIWTVWISDYIVETNEHISNISEIN